MNCEQARNLFDAYLDGELSPALETELHAHRLQCGSCRQDLALMEVAGHVIASGADQPPLRTDFTKRLLACLDPALPKPHPARTWIFRIGGAVAAAACLTLLVGYFSRPEPQVAGVVDRAGSATMVGQSQERPSPGLDAAATTLRRSFEDTYRETQQSSTSLARLGRMTLLQMIEALELEALRDPEAPDERAGQDADQVEEL